ncbi:DUF4189 domain-containing protein [Xanthomonas axonopodis]|nr:DUF4189 domain-containing protein [Xanthomonas axonopodis]
MLAILFCANAWAEQGCPPGMIPGGVDPHNMATCAPIPQGSSQQQSDQRRRPAGKWLKTWGAIAENDNGSDFGVSTGKLSKPDAENEAVKNCEKGIEKSVALFTPIKINASQLPSLMERVLSFRRPALPRRKQAIER